MGTYDELLTNLAEVDDDTLNSAHGEAKARITELKPKVADRSLSDEELAELVDLKPAFTQLHSEVGARTARREAAYAAADELAASLPEEAEADGDGDVATPAEPVAVEEAAPEPQLVAASAAPEPTPAPAAAPTTPPMGSVSKAAPAKPAGKAPMVITAAADVQGFAAGQQLDAKQIGKAMASRLRATANSGQAGNGEGLVAATITASDIPEERWLRAGDSVEHNTNKIQAVTSEQAITAAGGLCAPLEIDYSYRVLGTQGRPIRSSLPGFRVERGGIQFRKDLTPMLDATADGPKSATGFWTMADDVAADDPDAYLPDADPAGPLKVFWVVDCPATVTAQVETITFQIEFGNISTRFDPETMQNNVEQALIWHDRVCENHLLGQMQALSKYVTSTQLASMGATRELLVNLDKLQAYYRSVYRLSDSVRLRAILPFWAKNLIRSDLARQMSTDGSVGTLNVSDAQIEAFFATRNVTPVWHLDGSSVDQALVTGPPLVPAIKAQQYGQLAAGAAVPNYPAQIDILLHPEGHFQHLDGGTLDLGIVRDAELVRRNRYRQFSESFEGVAARGSADAFRYVASLVPTGGMSGTVAPSSVTA